MTEIKRDAEKSTRVHKKYDQYNHPKEFEKLSKGGHSLDEIATELGVRTASLYNWAKVHPEFSEVFSMHHQWGRALCDKKIRASWNDKNAQGGLMKSYAKAHYKRSYDDTMVELDIDKNLTFEEQADSIFHAVMTGECSLEVAERLMRILESKLGIMKRAQLEEKVKELYERVGIEY